MIAVAVVAILASVAIPSYQEHVRNSRRADAKADLLELAQFMERFFTVNNRYDQDTGGNPPILPFTQSPRSGTAYYTVSFEGGAPAQAAFTLQTIPVAGSAQANDGMLQLDNTGARRWDRDHDGNPDEAGENCWEKTC